MKFSVGSSEMNNLPPLASFLVNFLNKMLFLFIFSFSTGMFSHTQVMANYQEFTVALTPVRAPQMLSFVNTTPFGTFSSFIFLPCCCFAITTHSSQTSILSISSISQSDLIDDQSPVHVAL